MPLLFDRERVASVSGRILIWSHQCPYEGCVPIATTRAPRVARERLEHLANGRQQRHLGRSANDIAEWV